MNERTTPDGHGARAFLTAFRSNATACGRRVDGESARRFSHWRKSIGGWVVAGEPQARARTSLDASHRRQNEQIVTKPTGESGETIRDAHDEAKR